jgi:hypothetical protein
MTTDRTDHVVDLIDGAVGDWTSADAMRWRPEGARTKTASPARRRRDR